MMPPQSSGAVATGSRSCPRWNAKSARTVAYSAKPPSRSLPVKAALSHKFSRPEAQNRQTPQAPASQPMPAEPPAR